MLKTSLSIIEKLQAKGYEAYWAGGTVRDYLLGRDPVDYDIVTSAKPDEIESVLEKTIPVGKKFGVIIAVEGEHHFEVATFRSDAAYADGRRPNAIYFTSPEQDAKRRDFTINGMFYDVTNNRLLDFVDGQKDLRDKVLRFIGDPTERIREDNLRLLRAIRFKNTLGFEYAPGTVSAIRDNASLIKNVAPERIGSEITKILTGANRGQALREMANLGVLDFIVPELCEEKGINQPEIYHREGDVFEHTIRAMDALPNNLNPELAWAVLLHDVGKPETFAKLDRIRFNRHASVGSEIVRTVGKRLNFSNTFINHVSWLVGHHMMIGDLLKMKRARQAHWIHHPLFPELLALLRADALGTVPQDLSLYYELKELSEKKELLLPKPEQLITGGEIMREFGVPEGPRIGELLNEVHEQQMEEKIKTKEEARGLVRKLLTEID